MAAAPVFPVEIESISRIRTYVSDDYDLVNIAKHVYMLKKSGNGIVAWGLLSQIFSQMSNIFNKYRYTITIKHMPKQL